MFALQIMLSMHTAMPVQTCGMDMHSMPHKCSHHQSCNLFTECLDPQVHQAGSVQGSP